MLHPVHALSTRYFYPISNTPAVSLVSHQPPDKETIDMLLLGCGDIRNILYTVFCNQNEVLKTTKLVFTCCDIEPAILARNILLLSWLIDQKPIDDTANTYNWAAYYSILINSDCFHAIHERAALLVNLSASLSEWRQSKYAQILRMADTQTLAKVRQFWAKYCELADLPSKKRDKIRDRFMNDFFQIHEKRVQGASLSGLRSVGATCMDAIESVIEEFKRFWRSGVVGGLPELSEGATYINLLFVYSNIGGDRCVIHYGTDPILGFHCATAFAETIPGPSSNSLSQYSQNATLEEKVYNLARTAVLEFKLWCAAFQSVSCRVLQEPSLLRIYHIAGDALELCYSLQSALGKIDLTDNLFQTCAAPWNTPLHFNSNSDFLCPYDVIDTSNIADHLGLLNVLTCALPLLKHAANVILYTENLAQTTRKYSSLERLKSLLCGDPGSIFSLLGAAPMECLTGVSTSCTFHEEASFQFVLAEGHYVTQLRWRFSWKDIILGDQHVTEIYRTPLVPTWDADSLARTVVSIYTEMFKDEDLSSILQSVSRFDIMPKHYTRASFVAFLKLVQRRHHTNNWSDCFNKIIDLISKDNPISLQSQWAQELFLQLHIQRLHTSYVLQEALKSSTIYIPDSWPSIFRQSPLPQTIPFFFRIPRARCQHILKEFSSIDATTDIVLEVSVISPPFSNSYSVIQIAFADQVADIPLNWTDSQDLIVYVYLPAWTLLMSSRKASDISLRLQVDALAIQQFMHILGPELIVFQTSIWNTDYVLPKFIQQFPPVISSKVSVAPATAISGPGFRALVPKITSVNGCIEATTHIDVSGHNKARLAAGDKADGTQNSPCTFCVILGNSKMEIALPFPSQHCTSRLRIARKSGWIEVVTPFAISTSGSSFNFTKFPVIKGAPGSYYSWNMPRLLTKLLPRLNLSTNNNLSWISTNISSSFSRRERSLQEKHLKDPISGDDTVDMKENILSLFTRGAGVSATSKLECPQKVFFLDIHKAGVMTIIFLIGVRLEPSDSTLVADSYVLPLNPVLVSTLAKELSVLRDRRGVILQCSMDSYELWTLYIKASVERSRSWSHRPNCTGKLQDGMVDHLQQFLCRCGIGKVTREFKQISEWKPFVPFVTRCLFTPLFPVQCMEPIMTMDFSRSASSTPGGAEGESAVDKSCFTCKSKEGAASGKLLICTGCGKATYCSRECQKKDWKQHKASCRT